MANACRIYRQAFSQDMKKPRYGGNAVHLSQVNGIFLG